MYTYKKNPPCVLAEDLGLNKRQLYWLRFKFYKICFGILQLCNCGDTVIIQMP